MKPLHAQVKIVICSVLALLLCLSSFQFQVGAQAVQNVPTAGIAINGKIVDGINPIRVDGEMFLPFVQLSNILGYKDIRFESGTKTYQITDGSTLVRITMGGTRARRGDEFINIQAPRWINETAYVSLSAASVLFNSNVSFRPENGSIQVQKPASHYVVRSGDSLWAIAQAHHTTVQAFMAANNLTNHTIFPGQRLVIPPRNQTREMEPVRDERPVPAPSPSTTPAAQLRTNVINTAQQFIGAGYKFGATLQEAPRLFDCSSYTQYVFRLNGITLPRTSREQASMGVAVTNLQPGDLLFFTDSQLYSDGRVGHLGIYMGNGAMIHASSSRGVHIVPSVMTNNYWRRNYLFAKRIIQ
ncbi:NlpC/P60 family protein [Bacillus alkalicellulosilyticus]|uniref:C40 family peptidase n=1 Tax=Alkalihalobacterium alkalicellulosilyticum TaxID=1912214 RepID=UPI0009972087|nr:NlpC/P60 family protein [Bacillus alkalicellulosilyticus]